MSDEIIGYQEAIDMTLAHISPLNPTVVPLYDSTNHRNTLDVHALVASPSVNTSLKDGYAVRSEDIATASSEKPVTLEIVDVAAAGVPSTGSVRTGTAIQILTGAKIPHGADAVVAEEFIKKENKTIFVAHPEESGRNILPKGTDVETGDVIVRSGDRLTPGRVGLLASGGIATVTVTPRPRVAIIATGDEIVLPGEPLTEGKLFASNLAALNAWCRRFHMKTRLETTPDDEKRVSETLDRAARENEAVLTSGGAWSGDRDLVARVLDGLGWNKVYHRVRIGPGKAVGFGFLHQTPVFILPGGPPSNLMAFIHLALPALWRLAGNEGSPLKRKTVCLNEPVHGRVKNWTQYIFGQTSEDDMFQPIRWSSRLKCMAEAHGVIAIPEGLDHYPAGEKVTATLLI
jgi:molybdopterin molybdotransferase